MLNLVMGALFGTTGLNVGPFQGLTIFLLVFAIFLMLAGLFTSYFGSGKSRTIGVALLAVGLIAFIGTGYWYAYIYNGYSHDGIPLTRIIWQSFLVLFAAVLGALTAIAIFLVAIMKS